MLLFALAPDVPVPKWETDGNEVKVYLGLCIDWPKFAQSLYWEGWFTRGTYWIEGGEETVEATGRW